MLWLTSVGNELTVFSGTNPVSEHSAERPQKLYGLLGRGRRGGGGMAVGEEGDYIPIATLSPPE